LLSDVGDRWWWLQDLADKNWWRSVPQLDAVDQLKPIAEELGCSLAQLALAWCLKNPHVSTVITGATRSSRSGAHVKSAGSTRGPLLVFVL
jgi:aryl-alcohol dehydrogenase-like predicted oxidoreductase